MNLLVLILSCLLAVSFSVFMPQTHSLKDGRRRTPSAGRPNNTTNSTTTRRGFVNLNQTKSLRDRIYPIDADLPKQRSEAQSHKQPHGSIRNESASTGRDVTKDGNSTMDGIDVSPYVNQSAYYVAFLP